MFGQGLGGWEEQGEVEMVKESGGGGMSLPPRHHSGAPPRKVQRNTFVMFSDYCRGHGWLTNQNYCVHGNQLGQKGFLMEGLVQLSTKGPQEMFLGTYTLLLCL